MPQSIATISAWKKALIVLALVPIAAWWLLRLVDIPANGWFEATTTFAIGSDFTVFHTVGALIADSHGAEIYDVDLVQAEYVARTGRVAVENTAFGNTPAFGVLVAPLGLLSWEVAWVVWTAVGIAGLLAAVHLLHAPRPARFAAIAIFTLPVYFAMAFGQATLLWLVVVAGSFAALEGGKVRRAGAVAGLLILKPTLLLGLGIWWLIDREHRPALWAAVGTSVVVVVLTLPFVGSAWLDYPAAAVDFAQRHTGVEAQWAQFAPLGFFNLLFPGQRSLALVLGLVTVAAGVAVFLGYWREHRDDPILLFAGAIVLTLWVSPQVVAYEWTLLIAAGLLIYRSRPNLANELITVAAILGVTATGTIVLSNTLRPALGWTIQLAAPALAIAVWWLRPRLRHLDRESTTAVTG